MPDYSYIKDIGSNLVDLLESTGLFDDVRLGVPEKTPQFKRAVATVYMTEGSFENTMGSYNIPVEAKSVVFAVYRGTKPESYDRAMDDLTTIIGKFNSDKDWYTVKGATRMTSIESYQYIPRAVGQAFYTTIIYTLKHDVRQPY